LNWLEAKVAIAPHLNDPVGAWIIPAVAQRLIAAQIDTVGDLLNTINLKGRLWYRNLNQVGEVTAARLVKWLQLYEKDLGQSVSTFAMVKHRDLDVAAMEASRPKEFGIVPLEYFQPHPFLDGSVGKTVQNATGAASIMTMMPFSPGSNSSKTMPTPTAITEKKPNVFCCGLS
jgi:hypothetical protein